MTLCAFIGDELTAAGFRLAGARVHSPQAAEIPELFRRLRKIGGRAVADAYYDVFRPGLADLRTVRRLPDNPEDADTLFAFLTIAGTEFELIQPVSERFRHTLSATRSGAAGINHVAWKVSDIDACMRLLGDAGIGAGHVTPDGIVEFKDIKLVYLDPADTDGMLVELIEFLQG